MSENPAQIREGSGSRPVVDDLFSLKVHFWDVSSDPAKLRFWVNCLVSLLTLTIGSPGKRDV